eukprot:90299_1
MPCLNETIITSCLSVMCLLYMLALDVMHAIHRLFYNIKLASQIQYNVTKDISILFGFHSYILVIFILPLFVAGNTFKSLSLLLPIHTENFLFARTYRPLSLKCWFLDF